MIIQCESCARKFIVKDENIPEEGRNVKCGYCSVTWHQMPTNVAPKPIKKTSKKIVEDLSVDAIKASDGKTYKFLGSQWAQLLPSGKTGLFAQKKIGKELDKLTGRKKEIISNKQKKKTKKELDPSSENLNNNKQLPDIYKPNQGLGFFGYVFLLIIISFSIVGMLKTFENDLISYFPEIEYIFLLLNEQLEFLAESVKNIIVLINDLTKDY
jgi:predicted Zn finger-like uncharacterized protein